MSKPFKVFYLLIFLNFISCGGKSKLEARAVGNEIQEPPGETKSELPESRSQAKDPNSSVKDKILDLILQSLPDESKDSSIGQDIIEVIADLLSTDELIVLHAYMENLKNKQITVEANKELDIFTSILLNLVEEENDQYTSALSIQLIVETISSDRDIIVGDLEKKVMTHSIKDGGGPSNGDALIPEKDSFYFGKDIEAVKFLKPNFAESKFGLNNGELKNILEILLELPSVGNPAEYLSLTKNKDGCNESYVNQNKMSASIVPVADGEYHICINRIDSKGNFLDSIVIPNTLVIDSAAPEIETSNPEVFNQSTITDDSITFYGNVTYDIAGILSIKIKIQNPSNNFWNGSSFVSDSEGLTTIQFETSNWELSLPSSVVESGIYKISISVEDKLKNKREITTSHLVDLAPPDYEAPGWIGVATDGYINQQEQSANTDILSFPDLTPGEKIGYSIISSTMNCNDVSTWSDTKPKSSSFLAEGNFKACFKITDEAQNNQIISTENSIQIDLTNPSISVNSSTNLDPTTDSGTKTRIFGSTTDDESGLQSTKISIQKGTNSCFDGEFSFDQSCPNWLDTEDAFVYRISDLVLHDGTTYNFTVKATDTAQNQNTIQGSFNWQGPSIAFIHPDCSVSVTPCYSSIASWQTSKGGTSGNVVSETKSHVGVIVGEWINPDTTIIDLDNWTTNSSFTVALRTMGKARHKGIIEPAPKYYRLNPSTDGHAIILASDNFTIDGIVITGVTGGSNEGIRIESDQTLIENVIIHELLDASSDGIHFSNLTGGNQNATIRNSLFYEIGRSAILCQSENDVHINIKNVTAVHSTLSINNSNYPAIGIDAGNDCDNSSITVQNTIASGSGSSPSFNLTGTSTTWGTSSNNLSTDGTAPGASSFTNILISRNGNYINSDSAIIFGGYGLDDNQSVDLRVFSSPFVQSSNPGVDLSGEFTTDIAGLTRNYWTLGAHVMAGQDTFPEVAEIKRQYSSPTTRQTLGYEVVFTRDVTGVDTSDFRLEVSAGISNASITSVTGGPNSYEIIIDRGTGNGTIQLQAIDNNSIVAGSTPLASQSSADGSYRFGPRYKINSVADSTMLFNDSGNQGSREKSLIRAENGDFYAASNVNNLSIRRYSSDFKLKWEATINSTAGTGGIPSGPLQMGYGRICSMGSTWRLSAIGDQFTPDGEGQNNGSISIFNALNGKHLWSKAIASGSHDYVYGCVIDSDGTVYVLVSTSSSGLRVSNGASNNYIALTSPPKLGSNSNAVIIQFNKDGTYVKHRYYDTTTSGQGVFGRKLIPYSPTHMVLLIDTQGSDVVSASDSAGDLLGGRESVVALVEKSSLDLTTRHYISTAGDEILEDIIYFPEQSAFYLAGSTTGSFPGFTNSSPGNSDSVMLKLLENGTITWVHQETSSSGNDYFDGLSVSRDGTRMLACGSAFDNICGNTHTDNTTSDLFCNHFDQDGNRLGHFFNSDAAKQDVGGVLVSDDKTKFYLWGDTEADIDGTSNFQHSSEVYLMQKSLPTASCL